MYFVIFMSILCRFYAFKFPINAWKPAICTLTI